VLLKLGEKDGIVARSQEDYFEGDGRQNLESFFLLLE
jgi:hypothetical protein